MTINKIEMSNDLLYHLSGLAYNTWFHAYKTLKEVKKETNDNSPDWAEFHKSKLEAATKKEQITYDFFNEIKAQCKLYLTDFI